MFVGTREHLNPGCAAVIFSCWDSVNAPSGRVCKCWARAETKHSTSFQRWWPFLFSHSLTHLPPLIRYLLVPFSGGGERRGGRQPRELSPTPFPTFFIHPYVSPIDRFFTHPTPLSPLSNSKLATTYMGYADRALAHSNIRPSGSSLQRFNRVSKPFVRIVFTF